MFGLFSVSRPSLHVNYLYSNADRPRCIGRIEIVRSNGYGTQASKIIQLGTNALTAL